MLLASHGIFADGFQAVMASLYEAGDVVYTLATYTTPEWLTPNTTYNTATYPDAGALFAGADVSGFTATTIGYSTNRLNNVIYGNGQYLVVTGHGKIATSPDGVTWTDRPTVFGSDSIYNIIYANNLYVAVGLAGKIATSPDAINWTLRTSGLTAAQHVRAVGWNGSLFMVGGDGGFIRTSPDGITWTARTSGIATSIYNFETANGITVCVAAGGNLLTSPDGITWTARTSQFGTSNIFAVAYGSGKFIIVGASGKIANSVDGITWVLGTSGSGDTLYDIIYTGSSFMYVSITVFISFDGATWSSRVSNTGGQAILGVASGVNAVVLVTDLGSSAVSGFQPATTFTVPPYTAPSGYNVYVYSGVSA